MRVFTRHIFGCRYPILLSARVRVYLSLELYSICCSSTFISGHILLTSVRTGGSHGHGAALQDAVKSFGVWIIENTSSTVVPQIT